MAPLLRQESRDNSHQCYIRAVHKDWKQQRLPKVYPFESQKRLTKPGFVGSGVPAYQALNGGATNAEGVQDGHQKSLHVCRFFRQRLSECNRMQFSPDPLFGLRSLATFTALECLRKMGRCHQIHQRLKFGLIAQPSGARLRHVNRVVG